MAYRCDLCDKKTRQGRSSKHHPGVAGKQWKRRAQTTLRDFKPNLHMVTMPIGGVLTRVKACTDCISRAKLDARKAAARQVPVATA